MNPRWEMFRSGAAFYVGHIRARRGSRLVPVFTRRPRSRRWREAGRAPRAIRLFGKLD